MNKLIEKIIELESTKLANQYKIKDINRVFEIMKKTAIDTFGNKLNKKNEKIDPLENGLAYAPFLGDALKYLYKEDALKLFEQNNPEEIVTRGTVLLYLLDNSTPFYSHSELEKIISAFVDYLNINKTSLLDFGYPGYYFTKNYWIYRRFSNLYPVKIPYNIKEDSSNGEYPALLYYWNKDNKSGLTGYDKAPYINNFSLVDIANIEQKRSIILNIKNGILKTLYGSLINKSIKDLWNNCISTFSDLLTMDDFKILNRIEKKYENIFFLSEFTSDFYEIIANPVTGLRKDLDAGGIKNIIEIIQFVEYEIKFDKMNTTKEKLRKIIDVKKIESYYELVADKEIFNKVNLIIDDFLSISEKEEEFNLYFSDRLKKDIKTKFKIPLLVKPRYFDAAKSYTEYLEAHNDIGINISATYSKLPGNSELVPINIPPGTEWKDISIRFISEEEVHIKAGKFSKVANFIEMGFRNKRTNRPDSQWLFLKILAKNQGELSWNDSNTTDSGKKMKQLLANNLKAYFGLDKDPFLPYRSIKKYKVRFGLMPYQD